MTMCAKGRSASSIFMEKGERQRIAGAGEGSCRFDGALSREPRTPSTWSPPLYVGAAGPPGKAALRSWNPGDHDRPKIQMPALLNERLPRQGTTSFPDRLHRLRNKQ